MQPCAYALTSSVDSRVTSPYVGSGWFYLRISGSGWVGSGTRWLEYSEVKWTFGLLRVSSSETVDNAARRHLIGRQHVWRSSVWRSLHQNFFNRLHQVL